MKKDLVKNQVLQKRLRWRLSTWFLQTLSRKAEHFSHVMESSVCVKTICVAFMNNWIYFEYVSMFGVILCDEQIYLNSRTLKYLFCKVEK